MFGPGNFDIPCYHGDTLQFTMTIPEADLTGHTPLFQIRDGDDLLADWTSFMTIATSVVTVTVPGGTNPNGTSKLPRPLSRPPRSYEYDIQFTSPAGVVRTVLRGNLIVQGDISHG